MYLVISLPDMGNMCVCRINVHTCMCMCIGKKPFLVCKERWVHKFATQLIVCKIPGKEIVCHYIWLVYFGLAKGEK